MRHWNLFNYYKGLLLSDRGMIKVRTTERAMGAENEWHAHAPAPRSLALRYESHSLNAAMDIKQPERLPSLFRDVHMLEDH